MRRIVAMRSVTVLNTIRLSVSSPCQARIGQLEGNADAFHLVFRDVDRRVAWQALSKNLLTIATPELPAADGCCLYRLVQ